MRIELVFGYIEFQNVIDPLIEPARPIGIAVSRKEASRASVFAIERIEGYDSRSSLREFIEAEWALRSCERIDHALGLFHACSSSQLRACATVATVVVSNSSIFTRLAG